MVYGPLSVTSNAAKSRERSGWGRLHCQGKDRKHEIKSSGGMDRRVSALGLGTEKRMKSVVKEKSVKWPFHAS